MAGLNSMVVVMVVMMVASFQLQSAVAQTRHVVGDALGWNIPPNGAEYYITWASGQTFTVDDTLIFNFTTGFHNVAEVSQAAYGPCTTTNPMSTATTGPATITLTSSGTHYYLCTVGTHCQSGQKLTINVTSTGSTPPTATSPPPTGPMAQPLIPIPSPPPPSSATSFTAVLPLTFLAVALAFFY